MASLIHLDTHVAAWLFAGAVDLIPEQVRTLLDSKQLVISPMVVLELQYLYEVNKTTQPAQVVVEKLRREVGLEVCDLPFASVVERALAESWTHDPFDRVIVSQASLRGVPLATKDRSIRDHYPDAVWGK